jgi:two-component sensor histidine kinase
VHADDLDRIEAIRKRAFQGRRREYLKEYRIVRPSGEVRWVEGRVFVAYRGDGQPARVVGVDIDVTERKWAEERQRALRAELDHRVKNSLATISAIVTHTLNASSSMAEFAKALDGRLQSMARTHELLSVRGWQGISVAELVQRELSPHAMTGNAKIEGPEVILKAEAVQVIALVIHELVTNAVKYGALCVQNGRVSIRWAERPNRQTRSHLLLEWRERGGPLVVAPRKSSFGTSTIRDVIPYELGGTVDLVFAPEGVQCRLELPADWLTNNDEPVSATIKPCH